MRILIIEDEESIARILKKGLEKEGIAVDWVGTGEEGETRIMLYHKDYDLIVTDLMLPNKSGYDVCKSVRRAGITVPILVLTARSGVEDKVSLLDIGADDYIVKPFEFSELLARIRALVRRPKEVLPVELKAQNVRLDMTRKAVYLGDREVKLTLTEFRLLEYLLRNSHIVIERETLIDHVWDFNFASFSNVVDVYINRLRMKIDKGRQKPIIETVRGVGYKINVAG